MADNKELAHPNSLLELRFVWTKSVFNLSRTYTFFASHEHSDTMLADKLNDHQAQLRDRSPTIGIPRACLQLGSLYARTERNQRRNMVL